jgi:uncharacterized protein
VVCFVRNIHQKYKWGKKVQFTMTTNVTLLNNEVSRFLIENEFELMISLDGPEEIHDRNRILENGTGTFNIVESNIKEHENSILS